VIDGGVDLPELDLKRVADLDHGVLGGRSSLDYTLPESPDEG
jgi:hypothetical protein